MARVSYALRVGVAMGVSSLTALLPERGGPFWASTLPPPAPLLAPVFAGIAAAPPHLGAALKNSAHLAVGILLGVPLSTAALAAVGWSLRASVGAVVLLTFLVLLHPGLPPLSAKLALVVITVNSFSADLVPGFSLLFPLQLGLASLFGLVSGLGVSALPWPHSRACWASAEALATGERAASQLAALAARAFSDARDAPAPVAALRAHAEALHATAAAAWASLLAARDGVAWETCVGLRPPFRLSQRSAALEDALLRAEGMLLALDASRVAERAHVRAVERARLRHLAHAAAQQDAAAAWSPEVVANLSAAEDVQMHQLDAAAAEDAREMHELHLMERLLAAPAAELADAASAALLSASAEPATPPPLRGADVELATLRTPKAAAAALRRALTTFDAALLAARRRVYYRTPDETRCVPRTCGKVSGGHMTVLWCGQPQIVPRSSCGALRLPVFFAHVCDARCERCGSSRSC